MSLSVGDKLGPYEILAKIGAGGMGEVYQARDPRLGRDVAVKVSAERFSERFEREARAVAGLNHSNICTLYDVGPNYLVMELVEGESPKGPLPLDAALRIARQIAEALSEAHEKGVVHRDLKPGNIKVRPDGTVKVLDFGLAKVTEADGRYSQDSPTISMAATQAGVILGTAAYMSPEQARGKAVDKRADIWAFGVVLYEMLTGQQLFAGDDVTETLAKVIQSEPKWAEVPKSVQRLLKKCLEKDPKRRLRDIGDVWELLDQEHDGSKPASAGPRSAAGWITAAVTTLLAIIALWAPWRETGPGDLPLERLDVDLGADVTLPPPDTGGSAVVTSPDGRRLAWVATVGGSTRLFTRRLDQPRAAELSGTQGATSPFFSPDGQWIGFFAANKLNKISVEGGAVVPIADANGTYFWGEDDNIYLNLGLSNLSRLPVGGGEITKLTQLDSGKEFVHAFPQLLPGGKAMLFTAYPLPPSPDTAAVEVFTFADKRRTVLMRGGVYGRYLPTSTKMGHLVYGSKGSLFAVPFDPERLQIIGTAIPVLDNIASDPQAGRPQIDFSGNGTVVYRVGNGVSSSMATVQWMDSTGKMEALLPKPEMYLNEGFSLSPDGKRLALAISEGAASHIWVYDLARDTSTKLTFSGGPYGSPTWSSDGQYIFAGTLSFGMYWMRADGSSQPQQLTQSTAIQLPTSFRPDGKTLAFVEIDLAGGHPPQIWTVSVENEGGQWKAGKPEQFLKSKSVDNYPRFSRDGRWLAYSSNETGTFEVYVRPFPLPASDKGGKWTISTGGGNFPAWSPVGNELMYQAGDQVMAATYSEKGETFVLEKRRVWIPKLGGVSGFVLSLDARRILVVAPAQAPEAPRQEHTIVFLRNFFDELRRRVPLPK